MFYMQANSRIFPTTPLNSHVRRLLYSVPCASSGAGLWSLRDTALLSKSWKDGIIMFLVNWCEPSDQSGAQVVDLRGLKLNPVR